MRRPEPTLTFILAWERPIYLWLTLDSLYRNTRHPARFVVIDNGSTDPTVRRVIKGFERRGMFEQVVLASDNDPLRLQYVIDSFGDDLPDRFAIVDGDIAICSAEPDWLTEFHEIADSDPSIMYVGSLIDAGDFIPWKDARRLEPTLDQAKLVALAKASSPERAYPQGPNLPRFMPDLQPPGRLALCRREAMTRFGVQTDGRFNDLVREAGWKSGVATRVRHRHLSLLHLFDEPDYDTDARNAFFTADPRSKP